MRKLINKMLTLLAQAVGYIIVGVLTLIPVGMFIWLVQWILTMLGVM